MYSSRAALRCICCCWAGGKPHARTLTASSPYVLITRCAALHLLLLGRRQAARSHSHRKLAVCTHHALRCAACAVAGPEASRTLALSPQARRMYSPRAALRCMCCCWAGGKPHARTLTASSPYVL